jgi:hypothetical protein
MYISNHNLESAYFSQGWVFPGWVSFSKWIKQDWKEYPPRAMIVELTRMPEKNRESDPWYGLYLESKKYECLNKWMS